MGPSVGTARIHGRHPLTRETAIDEGGRAAHESREVARESLRADRSLSGPRTLHRQRSALAPEGTAVLAPRLLRPELSLTPVGVTHPDPHPQA